MLIDLQVPQTGALTDVLSRRTPRPDPILLYLNIPFCNSKCHFCDWVAQVPVRELRLTPVSDARQRYIVALQEQIRAYARQLNVAGYQPRIIYFGGGTASILTTEELRTVFGCLRSEFDLDGVVEATIEGSPESMTEDKLGVLRELGFNRISIGVQSFTEHRLRKIGRSHSAEQAYASVSLAHAAGFDNINIDLIVGFPGEQLSEVADKIRTALTLPVNHFSVYPYRASPGTVLRKQVDRGAVWPSIDEQLAAYREAADLLTAGGRPEYAMSYFGHPPCQSDDAYYRLTMDWIGFGAGANSLIGHRYLSTHKGRLATFNDAPTRFDEVVPAASPTLVMHFLSQALTTRQGISARLFEERVGIPLRTACQDPAAQGLLRRMSAHCELIIDRDGIRIPAAQMADTYVALSWIDLEQSA